MFTRGYAFGDPGLKKRPLFWPFLGATPKSLRLSSRLLALEVKLKGEINVDFEPHEKAEIWEHGGSNM